MNSEKKQFQQRVEQIDIPEEKLTTAINEAMKKGEKAKSKFQRAKRYIYSFAIAVVLLLAIMGSGFISPAMANMLTHIPIIGSVFVHEDVGLKEALEKGLVFPVNQTIVDKDIPITITNVYYDQSRLVIGYEIPLDDEGAEVGILNYNITINGLTLLSSQSTGAAEDNKFKGLIQTSSTLPDSFTLQVSFNKVFNTMGNWDFTIPVFVNDDYEYYLVHSTIEDEGYEFHMEEMILTPSGTKITVNVHTPFARKEEELSFSIYGENGKKLELIETKLQKERDSKSGIEIWSGTVFFAPIKKDDKITIVPGYLSANKKLVELNRLSMNIDIAELENKILTNDILDLVHIIPDMRTYMEDKIVEEVAEQLQIELGEYLIAELSALDTKFSIEYQKKQRLVHGMVEPIALLKDSSGIIIYKKSSGENVVTVIENINNEWVIVEEKTFKGISFNDLEETYNNEF
ncbi:MULTISPECIES: DUF4179 domain-containing protein [Sutcliffiella]|uniref:DUF4179 domain-containing protein n=1 Tax=Sutcliffiella cohnii TaxID=33932 RepID=A0A223KKE7_9BACI|nr:MULTISPECIES: DUF4179 domain-containing protein [Sutcliffiella]AST89833.1 hypothetical protein BC6307_00355 [Sutcliffiella cohnii]WBL15458.1 DUF4179 domain-containing protein [Sutcliffiella sp. NC1]